jgi:PKD repeat protein
MIKFYKLFGAVGLLFIMIGCNEEDPLLPLPTVSFETDPVIVEVGKTVTFKNLTTNASSYAWDFGNGQSSNEVSPSVVFEESGTFTVKLVAFTEDNQSDSVSQQINVGERVMSDMIINSIPFINLDGEDWDDATGLPDSTKHPDLLIVLGPEDDQTRIIATSPVIDLAPNFLPIIFSLNPGGDPYILTSEDWIMEFYDFDGEDIDNPQNEDFELMERLTFNPVTISTSAVGEDGLGFVQLAAGQYSVDLLFEIQ